MQQRGLLLINLGTPSAPTSSALRPYLREFLSDPRIIDLPGLLRWLLVNIVIVPLRAPRSAAAYRSIWTPQGSPLLYHSEALRAALEQSLGPSYVVRLGMRYGKPSIKDAITQLDACRATPLVVLPLFAQYASATIGSALQETLVHVARLRNVPSLSVVPPFFDHPAYVGALAEVVGGPLTDFAPDLLLLSFHGLPERQLERSDFDSVACDRDQPCPPVQMGNRFCYRAHCYATARALTTALGMPPQQVEVSFQSRLGRARWARPYTDEMLRRLRARGVRRLAVACPSFCTDCLETLEEIGLRARADWLAHGGEAFCLLPALNSHAAWVAAAVSLVRSVQP